MIAKPSPIVEMEATDYHNCEELSCSMLKVFLESPKMFFKRFIEKSIAPSTSAEMTLGSLAHAAILEPHVLEGHCVRIPAEVLNDQGHKRGKPWLEFKAANEGKTLLDDYDYLRIKAMFDSVYANEFANRLLRAEGQAEASIFWEWNGHKLRSRVDRLLPKYVVDVKTCRFGTADAFARGPYVNLAYYMQAALYLDAAKYVDGVERQFAFIVVESEEPYRSFVCIPDDRDLSLGRDEYRAAIEMIAEAKSKNDWREASELTMNRIKLPEWKFKTSI